MLLKLDNNRKLGLLFSAVLCLAAIHPVAGGWHWGTVRPWPAAIAAALLGIALLAPGLLAPLTRAWLALGELLQRIVSPIVLGAIFYLLITPVALVRRWRGSSPIPSRFDASAASYWKPRQPPGPDPKTLPRQF